MLIVLLKIFRISDAEFSPLRYAFTPKPSNTNVKLPKAWERRPATPFRPRGTGKNQKIWKRIVQDENAVDVALCNITKQKQENDGKIVKKLKLHDDAEGHNGIGTRWDGDVEEGGRKLKALLQSSRKRVGLVSNRQGALGLKDRADTKRKSLRLSISNVDEMDARNDALADTGIRIGAAADAEDSDRVEHSDDTEVISDIDMENLPLPIPNEERSSSTTSRTESQSLNSVDAAPEHTSINSTISPDESIERYNVEEDTSLPKTLTQSFIEPSSEDDTEFLQGFLSRAKAKKEAKAASCNDPAQWDESTERQQTARKSIANGEAGPASTSTGGSRVTSPRRSARTRVLKPPKIAPTVPSTIPVRRSNGTEFVFLQKDETQKLALTTRRNTQRNKGEAVHPTYRLLELKSPPEGSGRSERSRRPRSTSQSPRKRTKANDKQVQWDNQLAYFQDKQEASGNESSSKSRTKKVRRLGTPATKRSMQRMTLKEEGTPDNSSVFGPSEVRLRLRGD